MNGSLIIRLADLVIGLYSHTRQMYIYLDFVYWIM